MSRYYSAHSPVLSSSSACCVFHIKPLSFSPQQAAANRRTILSFMSTSSRKSSPNSSPALLSSSQSTPPYICRICRTEESDGRLLLSPCLCSGSLAHVHSACLLQWIDSRPAADPLTASSTSTDLISPASSSAPLSSAEPLNASAHVCELCQSPYRVSYTYTANSMSCNRALLHLTLDSCLVALLIALSLLLALSLPSSTSTLLWWCSVASLSVLAVVSFGLVLRRYYYNNATVTLVAAAEEEAAEERRQRPARLSMGVEGRSQAAGTEIAHQAAVGDVYVKLECE